jgi:acetylornithine deacetylase
MANIRNEIIHRVDSLRDYLISTTQELVRIPSINHPPNGDELECQMAVAKFLREIGLQPESYYLEGVPGLKEHSSFFPGRDYSNRPNVSARRKGKSGGRSLVFSGHIDTVPLGTTEWKHHPFGGEIAEGKLYGLGAFDMKAGIVANLGVMRVLQELDIPMKGDVILETVVDEEFGGVNGTIAGRLHGDIADAYIIPEPTGLVICNGGRGGLVAHITLSGPEGIIFEADEPGHAVRELDHFLKWIGIFRERRRKNLPGWESGPLDPIPVWITKISAGGWGWNVPITVPAEVKVELYMQLMPGETKDQVHRDLYGLLDEMIADKPNDFTDRPKIEFPIRFMSGSEIPVDSPLIITLNRCISEITGHTMLVRPMPAPSDMYVLHLDFNSPAVHFGPGGGNAHAADEFVIIEDILTVTKALSLLAVDWCEIDE